MKRKISVLIKTTFVLFLVVCTSNVYAQKVWGSDQEWTGKETKEEIWRKKIDLDMSVPDFKTTKVDQKVMGWRLAKMISYLQKTYLQGTYNRVWSSIRYDQTEDPRIRFVGVDKLEFVSAEKKDSVITIKWKTFTKLNKKEEVLNDINMTFVNGISNSETVNNLFNDICRYIRPYEEEYRRPA